MRAVSLVGNANNGGINMIELWIYLAGFVVSSFLVKNNKRIRRTIESFDEELRPLAIGLILIWPLTTICITVYWLGYAFYKLMRIDKLGSN